MKYVILIHSNPQPWGHPTQQFTEEGRALPPELHTEMDRGFEALMEEITASGEFVTAEALADPASATVFGWTPEGHVTTDGPYAETKEQLGGYYLLECKDLDDALNWAARIPEAKTGSIEVRPIMDYDALTAQAGGAEATAS
jgi:hypothetical protein